MLSAEGPSRSSSSSRGGRCGGVKRQGDGVGAGAQQQPDVCYQGVGAEIGFQDVGHAVIVEVLEEQESAYGRYRYQGSIRGADAHLHLVLEDAGYAWGSLEENLPRHSGSKICQSQPRTSELPSPQSMLSMPVSGIDGMLDVT